MDGTMLSRKFLVSAKDFFEPANHATTKRKTSESSAIDVSFESDDSGKHDDDETDMDVSYEYMSDGPEGTHFEGNYPDCSFHDQASYQREFSPAVRITELGLSSTNPVDLRTPIGTEDSCESHAMRGKTESIVTSTVSNCNESREAGFDSGSSDTDSDKVSIDNASMDPEDDTMSVMSEAADVLASPGERPQKKNKWGSFESSEGDSCEHADSVGGLAHLAPAQLRGALYASDGDGDECSANSELTEMLFSQTSIEHLTAVALSHGSDGDTAAAADGRTEDDQGDEGEGHGNYLSATTPLQLFVVRPAGNSQPPDELGSGSEQASAGDVSKRDGSAKRLSSVFGRTVLGFAGVMTVTAPVQPAAWSLPRTYTADGSQTLSTDASPRPTESLCSQEEAAEAAVAELCAKRAEQRAWSTTSSCSGSNTEQPEDVVVPGKGILQPDNGGGGSDGASADDDDDSDVNDDVGETMKDASETEEGGEGEGEDEGQRDSCDIHHGMCEIGRYTNQSDVSQIVVSADSDEMPSPDFVEATEDESLEDESGGDDATGAGPEEGAEGKDEPEENDGELMCLAAASVESVLGDAVQQVFGSESDESVPTEEADDESVDSPAPVCESSEAASTGSEPATLESAANTQEIGEQDPSKATISNTAGVSTVAEAETAATSMDVATEPETDDRMVQTAEASAVTEYTAPTKTIDGTASRSLLSMKYKYPYQHPLLYSAASVALVLLAYCIPGVADTVHTCIHSLCGTSSGGSSGDYNGEDVLVGVGTGDAAGGDVAM